MFAVGIDPDAFGITRNELALTLAEQNIETRCYYNPAVHRQSAYRQFASPLTDLTNTDLSSASVLCLPIWSTMADSVVSRVCCAIEQAHESARKARKKGAGEITLVG
jgi:dTDP-4-amino-4,6-dideoxygalactose transaminase